MKKTSVVAGVMLKSSGITVQLNANCSYSSFRNKLMHCKPISLPTHEKTILCTTWSLKLWDLQRLTVYDIRFLWIIIGPKLKEAKGGWRKFHKEELHYSKS